MALEVFRKQLKAVENGSCGQADFFLRFWLVVEGGERDPDGDDDLLRG